MRCMYHACLCVRHAGMSRVEAMRATARLGYRNVSSLPGACRRVRDAVKDRRFPRALAQLRELLSH